MEEENDQFPQKSNKAVFTFGRFQPPTKGHGVLIKEVERIAGSMEADGFIFVSSTQNKEKYFTSKKFYEMIESGTYVSTKDNENPLDVSTKVEYLKKMFPDVNVTFVNTTTCECTTLPKIIKKLEEAGYMDIQMVVGSDRVSSFSKAVSIPILGAGQERNLIGEANSGSLKTISGTKMRNAAVRGNFKKFQNGVQQGEMSDNNVRSLMKNIRKGLGFRNGGGRTRKRSKKMARTLKKK